METYDVIIVGAGPAGLSLASVLSQDNKVCVIEKNKIGTTTKSWASFRDRIKKLRLNSCVENNKINVLEFKHFLGAKWIFKDKYCQVNEAKLLNIFATRCKQTNTRFVENVKFDKFKRKKGHIKVNIKNNIVETKLLVDCSGSDSPIIKKFDLKDTYSSYPILGYNVKNIAVDPKTFIWEIMKTPHYKEIMIGGIMPYSTSVAQVHVFPYLKNKAVNPLSIKKYLTDYFQYYPGLKNAKIISKTNGTILMGELKKNALDNIFFFGEAALWTPRFIGVGLNQILKDHEKVAEELSRLLNENKLTEQFLSEIKPITQEKRILHLLRCFENIVFSLKSKPKKLNDFLIKINETHPKFGKYLMRNEFNKKIIKKTWKKLHEHFSIPELVEMLPKKDILYLMELGTELIEDSILEKYKKHLKDI